MKYNPFIPEQNNKNGKNSNLIKLVTIKLLYCKITFLLCHFGLLFSKILFITITVKLTSRKCPVV